MISFEYNLHKKRLFLILLAFISFFIGRITIFNLFNPVIIAFLSTLLFYKKLFNIAFIFSILGILSSHILPFPKYIFAICILFIINLILANKKYLTFHKALYASFSIFFAGAIIAFLNNFSFYLFIVTLIESLLAFFITIILNEGVIFLHQNKKALLSKELISIIALMAFVICGSINFYLFNIHVPYILIALLLIFISYIYGSLIAGITAFLSCVLLVFNDVFKENVLIIFTISSIICSFFANKNKLIFCFNFVLSLFLLSFLIDTALLKNTSFTYSIIISAVCFLIIPCPKMKELKFSLKAEEATTYTEKLKSITTLKLTSFANSFEKLSKTFLSLSEKKTTLEKQDISRLIDDVVSKVCIKCSLKNVCWGKNFYTSYQNIFSLLNTNIDANSFNKNDFSNYFLRNCINITQFIDVLNKTVEIYKLNLMWQNKLIESREIICKQLNGVSLIISELSKNINEEINFLEDTSLKIKKALNKNKIKTKDVIITENKDKIEVLIKAHPCYVPNKCTKTILPIVNEILGKKFYKECYNCIIKKENNESVCYIKLIEEQKYRIKTETIVSPKNKTNVSGDTHSAISLPGGKFLLAISDGMGSGKSAKKDSVATIELLEDFLSSGFSNELAINMINSALFLKSTKDTFATLDMCIINLYTGIAEFIKIGAASSFLIRNGEVILLKSTSLPIGVLNNLEPDIKLKKLQNDDILIMISDGVLDSNNNVWDKEKWLKNLLSNLKTKSIKDIANILFKETKNNYLDGLKDDITILVAKIWTSY